MLKRNWPIVNLCFTHREFEPDLRLVAGMGRDPPKVVYVFRQGIVGHNEWPFAEVALR